VIKAANNRNALHLEKGQKVVLGWRTEDCRALDPS
jgi:hypothetical protein